MENKYQRGQIYAIRSHQTDLIYIGSTIEPLHKRFYNHKKKSNLCSSREIIQYNDAYIELIENYPCNSKKELCRKEGEHIRNTNCVNKFIAGRTKNEYYIDTKDRKKEYSESNKDKINEYQKEFRKLNKDKIKEKMKEYRLKKKSLLESSSCSS